MAKTVGGQRTKPIQSEQVPPMAAAAIPASKLHPRNRHGGRYDFPRLMEVDVELDV
jgi:hypothetical protein